MTKLISTEEWLARPHRRKPNRNQGRMDRAMARCRATHNAFNAKRWAWIILLLIANFIAAAFIVTALGLR